MKVDGARHKCTVALASEAHGSIISCDDLVPFIKEELRLPGGSVYDISAVSAVDNADLAKIRATLDGAGYRPRD